MCYLDDTVSLSRQWWAQQTKPTPGSSSFLVYEQRHVENLNAIVD